ncbi:hypothetical protein EJB05_13966, partial [Eragrostis curvula]
RPPLLPFRRRPASTPRRPPLPSPPACFCSKGCRAAPPAPAPLGRIFAAPDSSAIPAAALHLPRTAPPCRLTSAAREVVLRQGESPPRLDLRRLRLLRHPCRPELCIRRPRRGRLPQGPSVDPQLLRLRDVDAVCPGLHAAGAIHIELLPRLLLPEPRSPAAAAAAPRRRQRCTGSTSTTTASVLAVRIHLVEDLHDARPSLPSRSAPLPLLLPLNKPLSYGIGEKCFTGCQIGYL